MTTPDRITTEEGTFDVAEVLGWSVDPHRYEAIVTTPTGPRLATWQHGGVWHLEEQRQERGE